MSAVGADGPFLESIIGRIVAARTSAVQSHVINRSLLFPLTTPMACIPTMPISTMIFIYQSSMGGQQSRVMLNSAMQPIVLLPVYLNSFLSRSMYLFNNLYPVMIWDACGSTIGPITSSRLGMPTVDIGIPQLAMHSCREIIGSQDPLRLSKVLKAFFDASDLSVELNKRLK